MADGGFDWAHAISGLGGAILGVLAGIAGHLYKAGGKEPTIRMDISSDITAAERRIEANMSAAEQRGESRIETIVNQFHDTFQALRQKINDVELDAVRNFVSKGDFEDFRKEYRDDKSRMFEKLDDLLGRQHDTGRFMRDKP